MIGAYPKGAYPACAYPKGAYPLYGLLVYIFSLLRTYKIPYEHRQRLIDAENRTRTIETEPRVYSVMNWEQT